MAVLPPLGPETPKLKGLQSFKRGEFLMFIAGLRLGLRLLEYSLEHQLMFQGSLPSMA